MQGNKPQGGRVARIRLSPKSCMRVSDVFTQVMGMSIQQRWGPLSFSYVVKTVLEGLLLALERDGKIPERTGFEWSHMMDQFAHGEEAIQVRTQQIRSTMSGQAVVDVDEKDWKPMPRAHVPVPEAKQEAYEVQVKRRRLEELKIKLMHAAESMDEDEMKEFKTLQAELE